MGLIPFASDPHPIWSPIAAEIHDLVWDRVGLPEVQKIVKRWATEQQAACDAYENDSEKFNDVCDKNEDLVISRSLKTSAERHIALLFPNGAFHQHQEPFPPESPEWPLPPRHGEVSRSVKWTGLAAIHDFFYFGEKINPWPKPEDEDLEAYTTWFQGEGGMCSAFVALMQRAGQLADGDILFIKRWLKELESPKGFNGYLTEEDCLILTALTEVYPRLLTQEKIEGKIPKMQVALRTIQKRLPILCEKGYVVRPEGTRSGYGISPSGLSIVEITK